MRFLSLATFALSLPATGCAAAISASGIKPSELTAPQVRAECPNAVATEHPDGTSSLTFRTHRKIAGPEYMWGMGYAVTLGLGELVWLPMEASSALRTAVFGREVVVHYDASGRVEQVTVGGERVLRSVREQVEASRRPPERAASGP